MRGACGFGENRITPPGPQAPPRPSWASQIACTEPPFSSIVFNLLSAKNPSERLSGDQKGKIAPSVSGSAWESNEFIGRTHSPVLPSALVAAKAIDAPSGESTGGPAPSPVRLIVVFSGGLMTVRMARAVWAGRKRNIPAAAPRIIAATKAAAQPRRSRACEGEGGNAATAGTDRSA